MCNAEQGRVLRKRCKDIEIMKALVPYSPCVSRLRPHTPDPHQHTHTSTRGWEKVKMEWRHSWRSQSLVVHTSNAAMPARLSTPPPPDSLMRSSANEFRVGASFWGPSNWPATLVWLGGVPDDLIPCPAHTTENGLCIQ